VLIQAKEVIKGLTEGYIMIYLKGKVWLSEKLLLVVIAHKMGKHCE
jgi:hypothetical protein